MLDKRILTNESQIFLGNSYRTFINNNAINKTLSFSDNLVLVENFDDLHIMI